MLHQVRAHVGSRPVELPVVGNPPPRSAAFFDHLGRRMAAGTRAALAPLGLRPRHYLALTLLRDSDGCGQAELAEWFGIDRTNLVGLLNELEADALIERRRDPQDRRRHLVAITDAGREQLARADFALAAVEDGVLGALDDAERRQLFDLLRRATAGAAVRPDCAAD
jgi:MarR family transcriptional regulator, lower aerobic nicotinate degradation pathway regulator